MDSERQSLKPIEGAARAARKRLPLKAEFALALLPTLVVLSVFLLVELVSRQRLLFASLASSAFLIYLDPEHGTNRVRTLILSQMLAAVIGFGAFSLLAPQAYIAGGIAMVLTIAVMILLDVVHPPAVSTSLAFAFRAGDEASLLIFAAAVLVTAMLVILQRSAVWMLARTLKKLH